jgi:lipopolysaccharide transport system ATP-binding protein
MSELAISVKNLSKCYQIYDRPIDRLKQFLLPGVKSFFKYPKSQHFTEFWALRDISFEVKKGEVVGIVGTNGSGKSTLLQLICGTLNPTLGNVLTSGRVAALLELGSGFNPEFSGRENVYMNAAILGLNKAEVDERFDEILAFAEIGQFIDQPVKTYSSGMMLRLAFAVAINVDPEILIIDEALSVGDERFQRKCYSRIEEIKAQGATILFVSHSGGTVIDLCDRAILIDSGELLAVGLPKQIVGRYQKLLYAPADKRLSIRQQIIDNLKLDNALSDSIQLEENIAIRNEEKHITESFDPHLIPTSSFDYESIGAQIKNPKILTLEGEQVNHLVRGRSYRYIYNVEFLDRASGVQFGMLIKTITGIELGGAVSASSIKNRIPHVEAGSNYLVEFRFVCSLNHGVYFLNAGVLANVNDEETYLHRQIDFAMFRVIDEPNSLKTGIIDFECFPEIQLEK